MTVTLNKKVCDKKPSCMMVALCPPVQFQYTQVNIQQSTRKHVKIVESVLLHAHIRHYRSHNFVG
jgi:hypothetical protein